MAQQELPKIANPKTTIYDNLLGVDFRADQTEVERRRSPDMVNMISDLGGNPIKRDGFRKVANAYGGLVLANSETYGIYVDATGVVAIPITVNSTGSAVITEDATRAITIPYTVPFGNIEEVFGYQQYIFIIFDNGAAKIDVTKYAEAWTVSCQITGIDTGMMSTGAIGSTAPVCDEIVPLSIIGLAPDATGTAGTVLYGKNLMSIYQQYSYAGDGTSTTYKIPLYSKMGAWAKVEVMDANGNWTTKTEGTHYNLGTASPETAASLDGTTTASYSIVDAQVVFTAGNIPPTPSSAIAGEDNVRITVAPFNNVDKVDINGNQETKGYYNENFAKLLGSKAHFLYEGRLFLGVSEKTYYSETSSPFLIPDNNWFDVDNAVICYQRMGSNLVIITQDTGKNTIFLASQVTATETLGNTQTATFSVKPTNAGVGAITSDVGGVLNDEPIFLSSTGLHGMLTNWSSEKYAINRSGRINRRLCREADLDSAVGCAFNGYYYLAINSHMYVLDGRHKDNMRNGETSYECYFFNAMPSIKEIFVANNRMLFTDDTGTYTWNDDLKDDLRYYDNLVLDNSGEFVSGDPVSAYWSSKFDDDNCPQILKTLKKKGSMAILVPQAHTGCYVTLVKNGDEFQQLGYTASSIFDFADIGFDEDEFSFEANAVAYDRFTKKKIKKYKRLQIIVGNDRAEPFALTKVVKTYDVGNYAKR